MDKLTNEESKEKKQGVGLITSVKYGIKHSIEEAKSKREAPLLDILAFAIAFIFARCHIVFGAHPLAIALLSVLPSRVWLAVLGAACGSLTMGKSGIIYSMISVIVVFLRIIVSGTDKSNTDPDNRKYLNLFSENLLLKMSAAIIGGFVAAVYEVLLSGFSSTTILFGASMIIISPLLAFGLSGLFDNDISLHSVFEGGSKALSSKGKSDKDKFDIKIGRAHV